jgi:hypothetical protein
LTDKIKELQAITAQGYVDKEVVFLNDIANMFAATPPDRLEDVLMFYLQLENGAIDGCRPTKNKGHRTAHQSASRTRNHLSANGSSFSFSVISKLADA